MKKKSAENGGTAADFFSFKSSIPIKNYIVIIKTDMTSQNLLHAKRLPPPPFMTVKLKS